jgi:two-component system phosphate regulon response regulator PhoB
MPLRISGFVERPSHTGLTGYRAISGERSADNSGGTAVTVVLVADDDADIRDLVAFKLEQAGLDVIVVEDGQAALEQARARQPALAVLDVSMPGLSGIDVCRMLRGDPVTAAMLIIMLTSRVQEQDVEGGFSAGADDYVTKPFSPRELVSRIQALLSRARA